MSSTHDCKIARERFQLDRLTMEVDLNRTIGGIILDLEQGLQSVQDAGEMFLHFSSSSFRELRHLGRPSPGTFCQPLEDWKEPDILGASRRLHVFEDEKARCKEYLTRMQEISERALNKTLIVCRLSDDLRFEVSG